MILFSKRKIEMANFDRCEDKVFLFGDIYVKIYIYDISKALVFAFAGAGHSVTREDVMNEVSPWGYDYLKKKGLNVIGFTNIKGSYNYYRDAVFFKCLKELAKKLPDFKERLAYGGSMGGYAASAFSNVLGVDRLLLLNPISTRNKEIASWDYEAKRALSSFHFDWKGEFADGADTNACGYVVYDPLYELDKKHAIRYSTLEKLKVPGLGHSIATYLHEMKMLNWLVDSFIENSIDIEKFHELARRKRKIKRYYDWMLSDENKYLTDRRAKVFLRHCNSLFSKGKTSERLSNADVEMAMSIADILSKTDLVDSIKFLKIIHGNRPDIKAVRLKILEYRSLIKVLE